MIAVDSFVFARHGVRSHAAPRPLSPAAFSTPALGIVSRKLGGSDRGCLERRFASKGYVAEEHARSGVRIEIDVPGTFSPEVSQASRRLMYWAVGNGNNPILNIHLNKAQLKT